MLALETGWTPDVIAGDTGVVSDAFRRACHWVLYARAMTLLVDELDEVRARSSEGLTVQAKAMLGSAQIAAATDAERYRKLLYPGDDDG